MVGIKSSRIRASFGARYEFDLTYDLVRVASKIDFPKPKLLMMTPAQYMRLNPNDSFMRERKQNNNFMIHVTSTNECIVISNNPDEDFGEDRPYFFAHEHAHAAQAEFAHCYSGIPITVKEQYLEDFFSEGHADALAVRALTYSPKLCEFAMHIDDEKEECFNNAMKELGAVDVEDFARKLAAFCSRLDFQYFATRYEYVLGYPFAQIYEDVPLEKLLAKPPVTFRELVVPGVYKS